MTSTKRSYYKRGKTYLDDKMSSSLIDTINNRAKQIAEDGDEKKLEQFIKDAANPARLNDLADKMAEDILILSRRDVKKAVKFEHKQKYKFEKGLYKTWHKTIDTYIELLGISLEAVDNHRKITYKNLRKNDDFFSFLLRLHTRVYRNANEILALMQSGYGAGALARWRSMHETTVVLAYAKEYGPKIIKFMVDHEAISSYKAIKEYQRYAGRLNQKLLNANEVNLAKAKFDQRLRKYGQSFKKDYGWAWAASDHKINSFRDLEEHVGIDHLYPYYKLSSLNIHMEWRSLFVGEEFDCLNDPGVALVGPADYGFEDAISLSLLTLEYATILILTYNLSYESMIYSKVIISVEQRAQNELNAEMNKLKNM